MCGNRNLAEKRSLDEVNETAEWLMVWLTQRNGDSPNSAIQPQTNYFDAGLIDSFGVIELITAIEDRFRIRFNERHFQDRRFPTIEGLSRLITELADSHVQGRHGRTNEHEGI